MKSDNVIVKKSKIEGIGVFANRDFKKDEIVMKWDLSVKITPEEVKKLPKSEQKFVMKYKNTLIYNQSPEKYVNHSCDGNSYEKDYCDIALRDIKKGEEITSNYGKAEKSKPHFKCNCGSKKCNHMILQY